MKKTWKNTCAVLHCTSLIHPEERPVHPIHTSSTPRSALRGARPRLPTWDTACPMQRNPPRGNSLLNARSASLQKGIACFFAGKCKCCAAYGKAWPRIRGCGAGRGGRSVPTEDVGNSHPVWAPATRLNWKQVNSK